MTEKAYRPAGPLSGLKWHRLRSTWNINRYWLLLGHRFRIARPNLSQALERRSGEDLWEMSSWYYTSPLMPKRRAEEIGGPELVVVAEHGRFGNAFRQVIQALAVADLIGAREVVAKNIPLMLKGSWKITDSLTLTHDSLLRPKVARKARLVLAGDFFVLPRLPVDLSSYDFHSLQEKLSEAYGLGDLQALDPQTLVIHIRSGDVFSENPHGAMAQPPLGFYIRAIEIANPDKVVVVFEDDRNPVIAGLINFLRERELPYLLSSSSLREDLFVLLSASQLVLSTGSFGPAVIALSPHLQFLYLFGQPTPLRFNTKKPSRVCHLEEPSGEYVNQMSPWKNSEVQRDLMMTFSARHLREHWS